MLSELARASMPPKRVDRAHDDIGRRRVSALALLLARGLDGDAWATVHGARNWIVIEVNIDKIVLFRPRVVMTMIGDVVMTMELMDAVVVVVAVVVRISASITWFGRRCTTSRRSFFVLFLNDRIL